MSMLLKLLQRFNCICEASEKQEHHYIFNRPDLPTESIFIPPRMLVIPFPTESYHQELLSFLDSFSGQYMVWNVSNARHPYFASRIIEHVHDFMPPLHEIFIISESLHKWLSLNPENIAIIHGDTAFLILSCFFVMHFRKYSNCIEALVSFGEIKNLNSPSVIRYLEYCDWIIAGINNKVSSKRLVLAKVILWNWMNCEDIKIQVNLVEVANENNDNQFCFYQEVEGDILIRGFCEKGLLFECMLHTSFVGLECFLYTQDLDCTELMPQTGCIKVEFTNTQETPGNKMELCWDMIRKAKGKRSVRQMFVNRHMEENNRILDEIFGEFK